jgi:hypothetical protein
MPFGLRINRTMALALEAAFAARLGQEVFTHAANEGVAVICPDDPDGVDAANVLFLVPPDGVEGMLRERLEGSQEFGAAFREAAWRSLVLGGRRSAAGCRVDHQAQIPETVFRRQGSGGFSPGRRGLAHLPDERFDAPGLSRVLRGLAGGEIAWSVADTAIQSPLARDMVWRVVAGFMYAGDRSTVAATTRVSADLVAEAVADAGLRPVARRRRPPGWGRWCGVRPRDTPREAARNSCSMCWSGWPCPSPNGTSWGMPWPGITACPCPDWKRPCRAGLVRFRPPHAAPDAEALVVAAENLPRLEAALDPDEGGGPSAACLEVVAEWLRFYGPVDPGFAAETLGLDPEWGREVVSALVRDGTLVLGRLVSGGGDADVCDTANFERLLRLVRTGNAPGCQACPWPG